MNETITTIVGNVVDTPGQRILDSGVSVTSFRVASTARRFDRVTNRWVDGDSLYLKVTCWRALAENTAASVVKGDPVVVTGRLYTRLYEVAESRRAAYELEATAIGFDLNRGRAQFKRISPSRAATVDEVGPDGIPTGGAVDAHLDTGVAAGAPLDEESADSVVTDLGDAEGTSDSASSDGHDPLTAESMAGAAPDASGSGDRAADHSPDERESAAPDTEAATPRPSGRRRGATPVPA